MFKFLAPALILSLCLLGCGDGGDDGNGMEPLEPPEFDVTGDWVVTEVDCDSDSLSQSEVLQFEMDVYEGLHVDIVQMGK